VSNALAHLEPCYMPDESVGLLPCHPGSDASSRSRGKLPARATPRSSWTNRCLIRITVRRLMESARTFCSSVELGSPWRMTHS
jgi:hypothetical protein